MIIKVIFWKKVEGEWYHKIRAFASWKDVSEYVDEIMNKEKKSFFKFQIEVTTKDHSYEI